MVYGCANSCVKFLFFLVNLLICIFGALIFGFSLWANLDKNFGSHLADFVRKVDGADHTHIDEISKYQASLWILVAVGALLFFVGFLGCCGAACESPILLGLFFFIVLILTAIELGATIFAMSNRDKFVDAVQKVMETSASTPEMRKNLKPIQDLFHCCGATASTKHLFIEDQMCTKEQEQWDDCFTRISTMIESSGEVIIVIAFILLAIEICSLIFSCILCRASREVRYAGYYA
ncbi:tetraspanin family protein [Oesophagostomum dentatum]|uniref:Tetraspanin n=1 Tax=Oesophagostomum dentatum TaxID=61180 RepID=A0A0B1TQK0_OESDE|nr:tetraspanin family protein [Oesophagostomum dentatum]